MIGGGAGVAPSTITTGTGVVTALGVNTGSTGAFVVNGGALGTPSSGTVTNLTGTASININGTVGATTANTGAFTTLSASSTVSGTGFSNYLASPPAIGGTAANTGTFTTIALGGNTQNQQLGAGNASIMKNRIINGAMVIDQRNAGASVTVPATTVTYGVDRWAAYNSQASKFTMQQSSTAPVGFNNSLLITSSAATTVSASDYYQLQQKIEGYNFADLNWGTANAKTVTLSFWVQSSLTGTFGGSFQNNGSSRNYPFSYTITTANTWQQISVTIAGDTTGTWVGATNGIGVIVSFSLGMGSSNTNTAGSWYGTYYGAPTSSVNLVATNGATFYITGVQLEVGSSATGFEYRQYQQELALCQRYYQIVQTGAVARYSDSLLVGGFSYLVPARTIPTIVYSKIVGDGSGSVNQNRSPTAYMASCFQSGGTTSGDCFYQALISAEL
jgi:hypothetical protein